jgi:uncharacterized protein (TIGR02145 family)
MSLEKKIFTKKRLKKSLIALAMLLASCNSGNSGGSNGDNTQQITGETDIGEGTVLGEHTIRLNPSQVFMYDKNTGQIVLSNMNVKYGDIIMMDATCDIAPHGLLRKVVSVNNYSSNLRNNSIVGETVKTTVANFEEAFKNLYIDKYFGINKNYTFGEIIFDGDENPQTSDDNVAIDGEVDLSGSGHVIWKIENYRTKKFLLSESIGAKLILQLTIGNNLVGNRLDIAKRLPTLELPPIPVVGVPLYTNLDLSAYFNADIFFDQELKAKLENNATFNAELSYDPYNHWQTTKYFQNDFKKTLQDPGDLNVDAIASIYPQISLMAYDSIGAYLGVNGGFEFIVDTGANQLWTLDAFVKGYLGAKADLFGFFSYDKSFTIYDETFRIAQASDGFGEGGNPGEEGGNDFEKGTMTDSRDGKIYKTVKIGNQTWMAENLDYSHQNSECYNSNPGNCAIYGRLYGFIGSQESCPLEWHLPTEDDWNILFNYFGGKADTSITGKLKSIGTIEEGTGLWKSPNSTATNESNFSALPGGWKNSNGSFVAKGTEASFGVYRSNEIKAYEFVYIDGILRYFSTQDKNKDLKFSVRCIKD